MGHKFVTTIANTDHAIKRMGVNSVTHKNLKKEKKKLKRKKCKGIYGSRGSTRFKYIYKRK